MSGSVEESAKEHDVEKNIADVAQEDRLNSKKLLFPKTSGWSFKFVPPSDSYFYNKQCEKLSMTTLCLGTI